MQCSCKYIKMRGIGIILFLLQNCSSIYGIPLNVPLKIYVHSLHEIKQNLFCLKHQISALSFKVVKVRILTALLRCQHKPAHGGNEFWAITKLTIKLKSNQPSQFASNLYTHKCCT